MSEHILQRSADDYISYEYLRGGKALTVLYLHGLLSSKKTLKAENIKSFCVENDFSYLALDYTAHGMSAGKPSDFRVGQSLKDTLDVIQKAAAQSPLLVVGNSLGGWISLLLAEKIPQQVKGLMVLAPAVDFTENVWNHIFDDKIREALKSGVVLGPSEETKGYCFTYDMFQDAAQYLLLNRTIHYTGPVELIQGDKDEFVPWQSVLKIKDGLESNDVRVHLLKNTGHRLITPEILAFTRDILKKLSERIIL